MTRDLISWTYRRLLAEYGPQAWWPAEDSAEIVVGAVLVQRTAWRNAELAIASLRRAGLLSLKSLAGSRTGHLATLVRPAGFPDVKASRLKGIARAFVSAGSFATLSRKSTDDLREFLLSLAGIGEETADAILLYAFDRPVLVVDAYLRRICARLRGREQPVRRQTDARLREAAASALESAADLNEFHALIVAHAKARCRSTPDCAGCCLGARCRTARTAGPGLSAARAESS